MHRDKRGVRRKGYGAEGRSKLAKREGKLTSPKVARRNELIRTCSTFFGGSAVVLFSQKRSLPGGAAFVHNVFDACTAP